MDTQKGYLRLFRKFIDWEWYDKPATKIIFIHCLLSANYKDKTWQGIKIKKGQFITSLEKLAKSNGLTIRQTRTALNDLQTTQEIDKQTTSRYTIITVKNYHLYQTNDKVISSPKRQTNDTPNDKQTTTTNNNSNTSYINSSSSSKEEIFEKISKEEEEILKNISKKNGIKYFRPWLRKILINGDYIKLLEDEKQKKTKKENISSNIQSDFKKVKTKLHACYFIGKYADSVGDNHPKEVIAIMEKYQIDSYTAATEYYYNNKEKKG